MPAILPLHSRHNRNTASVPDDPDDTRIPDGRSRRLPPVQLLPPPAAVSVSQTRRQAGGCASCMALALIAATSSWMDAIFSLVSG